MPANAGRRRLLHLLPGLIGLGLPGAAAAAGAETPPLRLLVGSMEIYEFRSRRGISACRTLLDATPQQETETRDKTAHRLLLAIDSLHPQTIHLTFDDTQRHQLFANLKGIENQCSGMERFLIAGQLVEPEGWTSIFRLAVVDACGRSRHELDVQVS